MSWRTRCPSRSTASIRSFLWSCSNRCVNILATCRRRCCSNTPPSTGWLLIWSSITPMPSGRRLQRLRRWPTNHRANSRKRPPQALAWTLRRRRAPMIWRSSVWRDSFPMLMMCRGSGPVCRLDASAPLQFLASAGRWKALRTRSVRSKGGATPQSVDLCGMSTRSITSFSISRRLKRSGWTPRSACFCRTLIRRSPMPGTGAVI
ncbi:hypothetical protein D3C76_699760 [compost metagenome]